MVDVFSYVTQFEGTHYDFGFMQGEQLKKTPIVANRRAYLSSNSKRNLNINEKTYYNVITRFAPQIWEEIKGLADSLEMSMESAIFQFGGYFLEYKKSGCTVFMGANYLVRNYDYHPSSYDGRFMIYKPTDKGYATIGPSMQITGRTDGINEKGLTVGYNFVNRRRSKDGFLCNMIGRILLETCANVDEAIELLKAIPHRNSFNYLILDPGGIPHIVEASPRSVSVRKDNACTNHFISLTDENRFHMDDSFRRMDMISKQKNNVKDSYDAYKMMNNIENDIYATQYEASNGTLHTAIYYPAERAAGFSLSPNRPPFMFDFNAWLKGKPIPVTQIRGQLNTHYPFANTTYLGE